MTIDKISSYTPGPWYHAKGSGGQGLIIAERTGKNIAVAYDEIDAPVLAAAPDLLQALEAILARVNGEWDHPSLMKYGELCQNQDDDITGIAEEAIRNAKGGK